MKKIDVKNLIELKSPGYFDQSSNLLTKLKIKFLEKLLHINEIDAFLEKHSDKKGIEFIGFYSDLK